MFAALVSLALTAEPVCLYCITSRIPGNIATNAFVTNGAVGLFDDATYGECVRVIIIEARENVGCLHTKTCVLEFFIDIIARVEHIIFLEIQGGEIVISHNVLHEDSPGAGVLFPGTFECLACR